MSRKRLILPLAAVIVAALVVVWFTVEKPLEVEPQVEPATSNVEDRAMEFYHGRPVFEQPMARSKTPEGLSDIRASTCGACHQEIYAEWKISTHARAWLDDAQYQAELKKSRGTGDDPSDMAWMCVNCHTPMLRQLPQVVVGLKGDQVDKPIYEDNPSFDAEMQLEAIGCATCHVRDGFVEGPWGDTKAPHAVRKSERLLTEETCTRCHQARNFYEDQNVGCYFSTGAEWEKSSVAKEGKVCQSCHMPEIDRKLAKSFEGPVRKTRRHWFGGSTIPKRPQDAADAQMMRDVFGHGLSMDLKPMTPELEALATAAPKLAEVDQKLRDSLHVPCKDDCQEFALIATNSNAGHNVPTGDPERHIDIDIEIGEPVVAREWTRFGSRYTWWPETKLLVDSRITPGESRVVRVQVPKSTLPTTVRVTASKYRMYADAFEHHHLEGKYVRGGEYAQYVWTIAKDGTVGLASPAPTR